MILGHVHLQDRGHNFCTRLSVLQTLFIIYTLFKERFHLGQFHPPQSWARSMRLQLLQNLKQEENNGEASILQFEMMEKWY